MRTVAVFVHLKRALFSERTFHFMPNGEVPFDSNRPQYLEPEVIHPLLVGPVEPKCAIPF